MATLHLTKDTTAEALRNEFFDNFGAQLRIYNGNKKAEMSDTLGTLGLTQEGEFECRSSLTAGSFIERMATEFGLKVKVYTCDEWVAVLDGLTLESAGKVKKNAVKADMESMIAYQRTDNETETSVAQVKKSASCGDYSIDILSDNKVIAKKGGVVCDNAKGTMREIAAQVGFVFDANWTTQQFGSKLVDFLNTGAKPVVDTAEAEAEKAAAEKAILEAERAKAEAERAEAEKAKTAAEKAKVDAEKAAVEKAKAEAAAAQAELERMKAEAAAAKAEAEKAKAEAEKAKAAADRAAAEKAKAEAEKTKAEADAVKPAATGANKGALPGVFSVGENKKVRFSMGNLQFNAKKYEFRFAEHQWDTISEKDNQQVSPTYDGWIDIFGYGTSGYMGCQPYESSTDDQHYPKQDIKGTKYDWGVYNPISNGGNKEGLWRTMTLEEWEYLGYKRPSCSKLQLMGTVNGKKGIILLPDDFYENRIRIPIDSTPNDYSSNSFNGDTWKTLEDIGAVFIPEDWSHLWTTGKFEKYVQLYVSGYCQRHIPCEAYGNRKNYHDKLQVRLVQDVK